MIHQDRIPHILKYMGGKREILPDIGLAVREMGTEASVFCDLFAGTAIVSYAFSDEFDVVSNDIQTYSSVLGHTYFSDFSELGDADTIVRQIMEECESVVDSIHVQFPELSFQYDEGMDFLSMERLENEQMSLIHQDFKSGFTFFMQSYSGTYWSYEQCLWIDAIRNVAESYSDSRLYYLILSSLMFAMSYCAQSTGHFAQFRPLTRDNFKSVLFYRLKSISSLFQKKMKELVHALSHPLPHHFRSSSLDYIDCISTLPPGSLIYADPPYSAVHYSRFYHALETLVRYDHPRLEYKGRYREGRYQSPFDQKGCVSRAFRLLFEAVRRQNCHLLLSYSDNALLPEVELHKIASESMGDDYRVIRHSKDYTHMKMGRSDEYKLDVHELLIAYTRV